MRRVCLSALFVVLAGSGAYAADNPHRDVQHTVLARRALMQDAKLTAFNLGVKVRNREVVLWGTVSSTALAKRAEELMRAVPELTQVRSELSVDADDRFAAAPVAEPLPTLGGIIVPTSGTPCEVDRVLPPRASAAPAVLTVRAMFPRTLTPPHQPRAAPPSASAPEPIRPAAAVLLAPDGRNTLEQDIRVLQEGAERFRRIHVEIHEQVVTLRGDSNDSATHEFARLVVRLPGVARVRVHQQ